MSSAAKSSTVRFFVGLMSLLSAIFALASAIVRFLMALVTALTSLVEAYSKRTSKVAASQPAPVAQAARPVAPAPVVQPVPVVPVAPAVAAAAPAPVAAVAAPAAPPARLKVSPTVCWRAYEAPAVECLSESDMAAPVDWAVLNANGAKIIETLGQFGVQGKVESILPGPTVTMYEVAPAPGTKVSKVAGLAEDLALAMGSRVRVLAPIPGKNRIGFELPNDAPAQVGLRGLLEGFGSAKGTLPVVLGRDTAGQPVYADLAAMPHLLVAGSTGSGKSVGLNVLLTSLLFKKGPEDLRLLMIDPKVVELGAYNGLPHMLCPVVTDMGKASTALKWAVDEMERRYQKLAETGARNITSYNEKVAKGAKGVKLPHVVIVVDEYADLVMSHGKEVEENVTRLAQKARAAGMHVILATQRPSVDVLTGLIKANFPSRIAFRVSQKVDSRIILDEGGAEALVGKGDMLVKLGGVDAVRVQCPWVSEEDVDRVVDFVKEQGEPRYEAALTSALSAEAPVQVKRAQLRVVA